MIKFEKVSKYKDVDFNLPVRKTKNSAGYDFEVAEDTVIPPFAEVQKKLYSQTNRLPKHPTLVDMARYTKEVCAKPTLVPLGVKCHLDPDTYLELSVRSSTPLKYWLVMANSVGRKKFFYKIQI